MFGGAKDTRRERGFLQASQEKHAGGQEWQRNSRRAVASRGPSGYKLQPMQNTIPELKAEAQEHALYVARETLVKYSGHAWWSYHKSQVESVEDLRAVVSALRRMPGHDSWNLAQAIQRLASAA